MTHEQTVPKFQQLQYAIAAYIRDPDNTPIPANINPKQIKVYAELLFNNIDSTLQGSFPVIYSILAKDQWLTMVRDFFKNHQSETPFFYEIPEEFLAFLQDKDYGFPFLTALAHYEWVELAIDLSVEEIPENINPDGDLLKEHPVLSPLAWVVHYNYAVQNIGPHLIPSKDDLEATDLIVYRNKYNVVNFMKINIVTARLLDLLKNNATLTGNEALNQITKELSHANPQVVIEGGTQTLKELRNEDIILGTR